MAQNSSSYKHLCSRISTIEKEYLPRLKSSGNYSKKEQDDTRAYILLVHAELESYFEKIGQEKAQNALNKWIANPKYNSQVLLSLACFIEQSQAIRSKSTTDEKLRLIVGSYRVIIKNNNGIKEKNIHDLFLPLGIEESTLDATLLNTLNSFGTTRGTYAHTGASVTTMPDPATIKADVGNIITALSDLDLRIKELK